MKFSELSRRIGGIDLSTLEGRISYQKRMYFANVLGVVKINDYSWYVYGPYSTYAARLGFDYIEDNNDSEIDVDESKIDKFNKFIQASGTSVTFLELISSIHFLKNNRNMSKDEIYKEIMNKRNYLGDSEKFERAWKFVEMSF